MSTESEQLEIVRGVLNVCFNRNDYAYESLFENVQILHLVWFYVLMGLLMLVLLATSLLLLFPPQCSTLFQFLMRILMWFDFIKERKWKRVSEKAPRQSIIPEQSQIPQVDSQDQLHSYGTSAQSNYIVTLSKDSIFILHGRKTVVGGVLTLILVLLFFATVLQTCAEYFDPTRYQVYPSLHVFQDDNALTTSSYYNAHDPTRQKELNTTFLFLADMYGSYPYSASPCNRTIIQQFIQLSVLNQSSNPIPIELQAVEDRERYSRYFGSCFIYFSIDMRHISSIFDEKSNKPFQFIMHYDKHIFNMRALSIVSNISYVGSESSLRFMPMFQQYLYSQRSACTYLNGLDGRWPSSTSHAMLTSRLVTFLFPKDWLTNTRYLLRIPYSNVAFFSNLQPIDTSNQDVSHNSVKKLQIDVFLQSDVSFSVTPTSLTRLIISILGILGGFFTLHPILRSILGAAIQFYLVHWTTRWISIIALGFGGTGLGVLVLLYTLQRDVDDTTTQRHWDGPLMPSVAISMIVVPLLLSLVLIWNNLCNYHSHYRRMLRGSEDDNTSTNVTGEMEEQVLLEETKT